MHPGAVFPDVGHFKQVRVKTGFLAGVAEGGFVETRGARRHHHPIQLMLYNILLQEGLPGVGAHIAIIFCYHHAGKGGGIFRHRFTVHGACDIEPAVADIHADSDLPVCLHHIPSPPLYLLNFLDCLVYFDAMMSEANPLGVHP